MSRHVVATVAELPPGARKLVNVKGRPIAIFNLGGEMFGLLNRCPHQGGSLCHGAITGLIEASHAGEYRLSREGEILRCPWHGWEYKLKTGECAPDPRMRLRSYEVVQREGGVYVVI